MKGNQRSRKHRTPPRHRNDSWADNFHEGQVFKIKDQVFKVTRIKKARRELHLTVHKSKAMGVS